MISILFDHLIGKHIHVTDFFCLIYSHKYREMRFDLYDQAYESKIEITRFTIFKVR